jgi:arsenate reductase
MAKLTLYAKKGWGTCENAKAWLSQNNPDVEIRDMLSEPPSRQLLGELAKIIPGGVKEMVTIRTESPEYQKNIAGKTLSDEQLLDLLAKIPNLLRKPLLVDGKRALQGVDDPAKLKAFLEGKP